MIKFLVQGGILGMSVITILGIAAIVVAVYVLIIHSSKKEVTTKMLNSVLYLGSMAFFAGLVWNALGLYEILDVIQKMGSVAQHTLAGGLKAACISTIYGLSLFFIAYVCWFLLRLRIAE